VKGDGAARRLVMPMPVLLVALLLASLGNRASAQEAVTFPQYDPRIGEIPFILRGPLYRPSGEGPFAAIIMHHGCGGVQSNSREWAEFLKSAGYVALVVDSFTTRGIRETCTGVSRVSYPDRMRDAYGALGYLSRLSFVDGRRIGAMGFSAGGAVTLFSVLTDIVKTFPTDYPRFKVAAALYPLCRDLPEREYFVQSRPISVALLILIGERDDWTPAAYCQTIVAQAQARGEKAFIRVYPGAHHAFDNLNMSVTHFPNVLNPNAPGGRGATAGGSQAARDAARTDLLAFLREYL